MHFLPCSSCLSSSAKVKCYAQCTSSFIGGMGIDTCRPLLLSACIQQLLTFFAHYLKLVSMGCKYLGHIHLATPLC